MAEYIKREDALEFPFANGIYDHEHANEHFISGCESYREWLEQIPAADVVERKTGKWILSQDCEHEYCTCSECGYDNGENWMIGSKIPYCEKCGSYNGGDDNGI